MGASATYKEIEMKNELPQIRRVIDGRVYDTCTATLVHLLTADEGSIALNFHVDRTALYRTRNGRFFIAGESGPLGRWGRRIDNSYIRGRGLKLVTDAEAKVHLEATDGPVEEFFDVEEG
jgi:hypothetical protein